MTIHLSTTGLLLGSFFLSKTQIDAGFAQQKIVLQSHRQYPWIALEKPQLKNHLSLRHLGPTHLTNPQLRSSSSLPLTRLMSHKHRPNKASKHIASWHKDFCMLDYDNGPSLRKRIKKDIFFKNYRLMPGTDVRHVIPLFLFREAILKAHLCHANDEQLMRYYTLKLKQCSVTPNTDASSALRQQFYSQVAKCRFNVFIGNSKENSLMGFYGITLHKLSQELKTYLCAIGDEPDATQAIAYINRIREYLFYKLLLGNKNDSFSMSVATLMGAEFNALSQACITQPNRPWPQVREEILKAIYRIRDTLVFDEPKGQHDGLRQTQYQYLLPAYHALQSYISSPKHDMRQFVKAIELLYRNEKACLAYFPKKHWQDLYPDLSQKNTHSKKAKTFANTIGEALLTAEH